MGDRANIAVLFPSRRGDHKRVAINFYTHWRGSQSAEVLADALGKAKDDGRWDDDSYLARIIFTELIAGDDSTTGFGISPTPPDNEYPYLVVDTVTQRVAVRDAGSWERRGAEWARAIKPVTDPDGWSFEQIVTMDPQALNVATGRA